MPDTKELAQAQVNVAMKDPEHLKNWLEASGRRWLIFRSVDLINALPWPQGVGQLMGVINTYRDYRGGIPSGELEKMTHPVTGEEFEVAIMKTDLLEVNELDQAIRFLIGKITEKDGTWKLENSPL
jgi:hypothetical protein